MARVSPRYRAKAEVVDGIRFGSKAEAKRYHELRLMERAGEISGLDLQPRYDITINGIRCGFYKADFRYTLKGKGRVIEDVKGYSGDTETYRLKKKLVEALYSITITEIGGKSARRAA